jgi:hypothetical protein
VCEQSEEPENGNNDGDPKQHGCLLCGCSNDGKLVFGHYIATETG